MDDEISNIVHSMFGKSVQVVDCEKTSTVHQEEVLLINGIPVSFEGDAGKEIKNNLLTGQVPSVELLNKLLYQAGILKQSVQLETSLSVKSSMVTTEEVSVNKGGENIDSRTSEKKEDFTYNSSRTDIWNPMKTKVIEPLSNTSISQQKPCTTKSALLSDNNVMVCRREDEGSNLLATSETQTLTVSSRVDNVHDDDCDNNDDDDDEDDVDHVHYHDHDNDKGNIGDNHNHGRDDDNDDYKDDFERELFLLNQRQCNKSDSVETQSLSTNNTDMSLFYSNDNTQQLSSSSITIAHGSCSQCSPKKYPQTFEFKRKSSLLSSDSGHYECSNSASEQALNNNPQLSTSSQTKARQPSISPCYDNPSSKAADFLSVTSDNKSEYLLPTVSYPSSHEKIVKSPTLGKKLPMSSNSCSSVSKPLLTKPTQQRQQSHHESIGKASAISASSSSNNADFAHTSIRTDKETSSAAIPSTSENGLIFRDGNLVSGPLEALIAHMVPSANYYPNRSFIFSFLLSARLFIRPHELLSRISYIWENQHQSTDVVDEKYLPSSNELFPHQQSISKNSTGKSLFQFPNEQAHQKAMKSAQNCIQLLSEWIDTFPYDFRDERLMQHVRVLARKCVYIDNRLGKTVSSILQQLVQRLTVLEKYEEFLQTLAANETNEHEEQQKNQDLTATTYQTSSSYVSSSAAAGGGHTNSGYVHASTTSTSCNNDPGAILPESINNDNSNASRFSSAEDMKRQTSHKTFSSSSSSSYTTASGTLHQYQLGHQTNKHQQQQQQQNTQQSDSSSNSLNMVGPALGGGGLGLGVTGYTSSSSAIMNSAELIGICDLCPNAALLAHQLTHIELERLSHIGPEEFVQSFAKENHLESFSDMKKTRNLESYVEWFNRLSYFTATEIVKYPKKKQRVRIIEFWIETARECFNIGNFNSLMAIIAGLNLSPISRLKKTWSKIQSAKFSVLEHQMDPTSNFNSYRSTLKAAMWRSEGATNERERIIIPFFSLLVKDLYFLNEGCSNRLPNGHINFEKFWQLAKQVMEFNTWKKVTCPFEKLPKVIMFLQSITVLNENTLSIASFECEPPENTQEKGRYKTLKSETKQHQQT